MSRSLRVVLPLAIVGSLALSGVAVGQTTGSTVEDLRVPASSNGLDFADRVGPTTPTAPPPAPSAPPTTAATPPWNGGRVTAPVSWPADGAVVNGFVEIWLEPNGPVQGLKWYVDGKEVGYDGNGAPWVKGWDSSSLPDGTYEIYSKARQPTVSPDAGRWFTSKKITVTVDNSSVSSGLTRAPRGDLPGWDHIYADDFDAPVARGDFPDRVGDRWSAYPAPWRDTSGKGIYDPGRVVSVADGVLTKNLRTVDGSPRVSALIPKLTDQTKFGQRYGRYEVRFRTSKPAGYKVAWMLWPVSGTNITGSASGTGGNGEIDFPEMNLDAQKVMGFVHHQDATRGDDQYWSRTTVDVSDWHVYTIEWSPDLVVFRLDGVEVGRTTERVPHTAMRWILQTETTLSGSTPSGSQGTVEIDWVSAWAHDG